jgi:hypothetical protein
MFGIQRDGSVLHLNVFTICKRYRASPCKSLASQSPSLSDVPVVILEVAGTHHIAHLFLPMFWSPSASSLGWCVSPHLLFSIFLRAFSEGVHWCNGYDGVKLTSQNCGLYGPNVHLRVTEMWTMV